MPKASEVAAELRKLAESLDREPDTEVSQPWITFWPSKNALLALARLLPRPYAKKWEKDTVELIYGNTGTAPIYLRVSSSRANICHLVKAAQPAVYDCEPLLSEAEEAQIGGAA